MQKRIKIEQSEVHGKIRRITMHRDNETEQELYNLLTKELHNMKDVVGFGFYGDSGFICQKVNTKESNMNKIITKAKEYAKKKHLNQTRDDGNPYIVHPLQTAEILTAVTEDENLIAAAILHDVIEDCEVTHAELVKEFNEDVANLVQEVSKQKPDPKKASFFPHLQTQRGIMLKFADRLSNLSDLKSWTDEKKQWYFDTSKFWRSSIDDDIYKRARKRPISAQPVKQIKGQITLDQAIKEAK
jgi:GTP pyrophosphokinase